MSVIDLDAAREEAAADGAVAHEVKLGGETFNVPAVEQWPVAAIKSIREGAFDDALAVVLGDDWDRFASHRPTLADCKVLVDGIMEGQGVGDTGNSPRSSSSSASTGTT